MDFQQAQGLRVAINAHLNQHTVRLSQNTPPYSQMTAIKRKGRFQMLSVSSINYEQEVS